jgi:hypothetical protein
MAICKRLGVKHWRHLAVSYRRSIATCSPTSGAWEPEVTGHKEVLEGSGIQANEALSHLGARDAQWGKRNSLPPTADYAENF